MFGILVAFVVESRPTAQIAQFIILVTIFLESRPAAQTVEFKVLVTICVELNNFALEPPVYHPPQHHGSICEEFTIIGYFAT